MPVVTSQSISEKSLKHQNDILLIPCKSANFLAFGIYDS